MKKIWQCAFCRYSTTNISQLQNHVTKHTKEKPFRCSICHAAFAFRDLLNHHMSTHKNAKIYKCESCEFRSVDKWALHKHAVIHSDEKPYECEICNYKTKHRRDLKRHREIHTGEKRFKCDVCEYKAYRRANLKVHMNIHTGIKPFACDKCAFKTARKMNLKKHAKLHDNDNSVLQHKKTYATKKVYQCNICDYRGGSKAWFNRHTATHLKEFTDNKDLQKENFEQFATTAKCIKEEVCHDQVSDQTRFQPCNVRAISDIKNEFHGTKVSSEGSFDRNKMKTENWDHEILVKIRKQIRKLYYE